MGTSVRVGAAAETSPARGVWAVWIAATACIGTLIVALGSNVPYWDDWEYVPALTGHQPLTPAFLWGLHNEHRLPLPRLLYIASFHLGGGDFRAIMLVSAALLSAAAALLVRAAAQARGSASWTDATLPLLLLHPGHEDNLLWSFDILFVVPVFLACLALATIVSIRDAVTRRQALVIGVAAILMPLCSGPGLVLGSAFGGWLAWRSVSSRTPAQDPAAAGRPLLGALGLLCLAVCLAYFVNYHGNPAHPKPAGLAAAARSTADVLSVALGPAATTFGRTAALLVSALILGTALAVAAWWWRSPAQRLQAESLLAALAATGGLVLVIAWGRSGFPAGSGRAPRYVTLAAPVVAWSYMAWCRLPSRQAARVVQIGLLALCLALLPLNISFGLAGAHERYERLQALVQDLEQGMTLELATERHAGSVYPGAGRLREWLEMLQARRLGPFSHGATATRFLRLYPFLRAPLIRLRPGSISPREASVNHRPVLVVPSEGEAVFDVRAGLTRARGRFGVLPWVATAPTQPGEPAFDGTYFTVSFRPDNGEEQQVLAAHLNPRTREQDREAQSFDLSLPGAAGELVLRTKFGPPGTEATGFGDWGYWSDVVLR